MASGRERRQGPASVASERGTGITLSLPDELILMLLNEENGYFHQVPGWNLNCVVIGSVLAELSLMNRIDTDLESLFLIDKTETGNPTLDPALEAIAAEPGHHTTQYWIERLAPLADSVIEHTLDRLVDLNILQHYEGDFWTLSRATLRGETGNSASDFSAADFVKNRITVAIFNNEIPDPRDIILICLINTCDIFRFIFPLEAEDEERIAFICNLDVIGRSLAQAVSHNLAPPYLRHSGLTKRIPSISVRRLLPRPQLRNGNLPSLFADLAKEYGPVFKINIPFKEPLVFIAGPETNHWAHRQGRMYLRTRDYFHDFEQVYGAAGVLPSLDGADHFRLRKSLQPAYSRERLEVQLDKVCNNGRAVMANWNVGDALPASRTSRHVVNAQLSPLFVGVESQDLIDDLLKYKERALSVYIVKSLPKLLLNTPGMRRRAGAIDVLMERVQSVHTPAQRANQVRDLADDFLSLHASDPQFMPESNFKFVFSAALIASAYLGDMMSFCWYALAAHPELHAEIRREADALFANGDPSGEDITPDAVDVTRRFMMECLRLYPIVPMSMRNVMNTCVVEGYELPVGTRLHIAQSATHYMDSVFPNATKFDIDRYLPPRNEHHGSSYAPYGLGTHSCLGSRWMELQLTTNILMLARHFTFEVTPRKYQDMDKLKISPLPSLKPHKSVKLVVAEKRGL
ncbi:MAG: cytochrome P450 [Chloroflexota bacterium]|nr:cytochrome P450 [Chloroflexota bacterium]